MKDGELKTYITKSINELKLIELDSNFNKNEIPSVSELTIDSYGNLCFHG